MVWTAPMTAVATATFSCQEFNQYIRDNLMTTAPALATAAGNFFVTIGGQAIAQRVPGEDTISTSQTTTSTSYTNLSTVGPAVTVETGTEALAFWTCDLSNSSADASTIVSVECKGTSNHPARDSWRSMNDGVPASQVSRASGFHRFEAITPGSNTFTMKYRVSSGTGTFADRHLFVLPF